MKTSKEVIKLGKKLRAEALEKHGWRLLPVWGVFRDEAERLLETKKKELFKTI